MPEKRLKNTTAKTPLNNKTGPRHGRRSIGAGYRRGSRIVVIKTDVVAAGDEVTVLPGTGLRFPVLHQAGGGPDGVE